MSRENYNDLLAFIAVARERSFTRAAAKLGVSQAALSYTIRAFEAKMGVRLLTRTTRSVSPTEAGERLMSVAPLLEEIEAELEAVGEMGDKPVGTVRISATQNATDNVLWPRLIELLPKCPELKVEITVDNRLVDIVADRYDMGVRLGNEVASDMTAIRIGPDMQTAIVGSPAYLAQRPRPQTPEDLLAHECINLRLMAQGGLYAWELKKGTKLLDVKVDGRLVFNDTRQILQAALAGFGLGFVPKDMALPYLASGQLEQVLEDWCPAFQGYHLYYSNRRHFSRAMAVVVEALRYPPSRAAPTG